MTKFFRDVFNKRIRKRRGFTRYINGLCAGFTFILRHAQYRAKGRKAFTLIELLVVLVVTSGLSAFLIIYNHASRQQVALYVEEAKLVQVISRAKSLSLSTYREESAEICGYGIHIDYGNNRYSLFSYAKPSGIECKKITNIDLEAEVQISQFSLSNDLVFISPPPKGGDRIDDIIFIPPDPTTLMDSGGSFISDGFGNIALGTQDGSAVVTVTVSSAGQITF
ncbi:MAG: prepilin-type N-terminal cleavage/methylation domain-containing protein [Candidatus Liptonbacteria bacterium]|nr:prepilin-type N-terminal cleavage/methylation domain-containing protein [Candidatus Liptonbacteria bacterium]